MIERVEPWGDRRLDLLFARMTAVIANIVRDDKKQPEPYVASDFILDWNEIWEAAANASGRAEPVETEEEDLARTSALADKVVWINTWLGGVS